MVKTRKGNSTQPQSTPQLCSAAHNAGQEPQSLYVTTTPMQRVTCERARHPSTLNVEAALARIPKQPNSSCACGVQSMQPANKSSSSVRRGEFWKQFIY